MANTQAEYSRAVTHDHSHDYRAAGKRSLILVLCLISVHIGIEITGGILSGSLGLLAHATHMVTDAVAISLALFAMWIADRPATITRTFGFLRIEVLAVLLNAIAPCILASWIFFGAYQRFSGLADDHSHQLEGGIMLAVALTGLVINAVAAWTLNRSSTHNINVEGRSGTSWPTWQDRLPWSFPACSWFSSIGNWWTPFSACSSAFSSWPVRSASR